MSDIDIPLADNFEAAPGVDYGDAPVETPVTPEETPEVTPAPEPTVEPEKTETPAEPAEPEKVERSKPKPIASLLEKKHELETQNAEKDARIAELEAKVKAVSKQSPSVSADDDVKALAEEFGLDETLLARIVDTARKGVTPEIPKEFQDLIAERQAEKQQQEELAGFNTRVDSLAKALPAEQFSDPKVREKLLELAYSTEKAPDGEPYFKKELSELYFAYIKPEIEPGKTTAETSQGGTQTAAPMLDFEEIFNRDNPKDIDDMDSETFTKYNAWVLEHKETKSPIKRNG